MRLLFIARPARQVAPPAEDKLAFWTACRDYIDVLRQAGRLEAYFWTNSLPPGLGSPTAMAGVGILDVQSVEGAKTLLFAYPGTELEGGLAYELAPLPDGDGAYRAKRPDGYRFLAMGKRTLYQAPPVADKIAFEQSCRAYLRERVDAGQIECLAWALGPNQVCAYVFLNVDTHEELYAVLRDYPGTTQEQGYQWEIHTLLDSDYCFNSMMDEARERAGAK